MSSAKRVIRRKLRFIYKISLIHHDKHFLLFSYFAFVHIAKHKKPKKCVALFLELYDN